MLTLLAAATLSLSVSACGSDSADSTEALAPSSLLTPAEIEKYPAGTVERAFFEFWSALQFQSWSDALSYYDPALRDFIGAKTLVEAKQLETASFPHLKPVLTRVKEDGPESTIYYTLTREDGTREYVSINWRKADGNWRIVYDSRLNAELNQLARNRVEVRENGSLPTDATAAPSPEAVRAGERASKLQARFLEEETEEATEAETEEEAEAETEEEAP